MDQQHGLVNIPGMVEICVGLDVGAGLHRSQKSTFPSLESILLGQLRRDSGLEGLLWVYFELDGGVICRFFGMIDGAIESCGV